MKQLIEQIKKWGADKGITGPNGKGTLLSQLGKTQEELTETRDAAVSLNANKQRDISEGLHYDDCLYADMDDIKDGLGDTVVTLILAAEMAGLDFEECVQAAYDEIKGRTGKMENGVFVKDKP